MYSDRYDDILNRMKENTPDELNKGEGTYIHLILAALALELEKNNLNMEELKNSVFIDRAYYNGYDDEVVERCKEHGIYRKEGKKAKTIVIFKGVQGTEIPVNFVVQTSNNLQFKTLKTVTIDQDNSIQVEVEALEVGNVYNVKKNTITDIPVKLVGLDTVSNPKDVVSGIDKESIKSLYERYKLKVVTPATSGNKYHYRLWALEVPGVGDAMVKPLWNGPGTVKVIIVGQDRNKPTEEIVKNVTNHMNEVRPVCGGELTVEAVNDVGLNVEVTLKYSEATNIETLKSNIEKSINNYLKTVAFEEKIIRYTYIGNAILLVEGVIDYENLKINGDTKNIPLEDSVGSVKEVIINE